MEGVQNIRSHVFQYFASHLKAPNLDRLGVENLHFKTLSIMESKDLIRPFSLEEARQTTWDYGS